MHTEKSNVFAENIKNTGTNHNKSYQLLSSAKMFWKASLINGVDPDQTALNTNNMDPDQTALTGVVCLDPYCTGSSPIWVHTVCFYTYIKR